MKQADLIEEADVVKVILEELNAFLNSDKYANMATRTRRQLKREIEDIIQNLEALQADERG